MCVSFCGDILCTIKAKKKNNNTGSSFISSTLRTLIIIVVRVLSPPWPLLLPLALSGANPAAAKTVPATQNRTVPTTCSRWNGSGFDGPPVSPRRYL